MQSGRELVGQSANLATPYAIAVAGPFLVLGDNGDSMLALFDRKSGRKLATGGRMGAGPGEFKDVWAIQTLQLDSGAQAIWVYDATQDRVSEYLASASGMLRYAGRQIQSQLLGKPLALDWLNDTSLLTVGYFDRGRFEIVDTSGREMAARGAIPLASPTFPALAAQQALQPTAALRPDHRAVAVASRYAARVDMYDVSTGEVQTAQVPIPFAPALRLLRNGKVPVFLQDKDTRLGYIGIAATQSRVYALFSGRTRPEYPHRANFGSQVHVFDWTGRFIDAIDLGRDAIQIAVDSSDSLLYAVVHDPAPAVYVYAVSASPDLLNSRRK